MSAKTSMLFPRSLVHACVSLYSKQATSTWVVSGKYDTIQYWYLGLCLPESGCHPSRWPYRSIQEYDAIFHSLSSLFLIFPHLFQLSPWVRRGRDPSICLLTHRGAPPILQLAVGGVFPPRRLSHSVLVLDYDTTLTTPTDTTTT